MNPHGPVAPVAPVTSPDSTAPVYGTIRDSKSLTVTQSRDATGAVTGYVLRIQGGSVATFPFTPTEWAGFVDDITDVRTGPNGCTDWSAHWCDHHGNCVCGDGFENGEFDDECPLHGSASLHAETGSGVPA